MHIVGNKFVICKERNKSYNIMVVDSFHIKFHSQNATAHNFAEMMIKMGHSYCMMVK